MSVSQEVEDALFVAALDVSDPEARRQFLNKACLGDPALRSAVESLLAAQATAEAFFERGLSATSEIGVRASELATDSEVPPRDESIGKSLNQYTLLQCLGEGGCGVVYLAEQKSPIHRQVALKIIRLGMDTRCVIARFDAERQALEMMDHPNIARALDAGATETGRPYFVMELVRGLKITDYCDQNHLDIRQRLDLFIHICQAIQHAHQKGVIHRDIKPSNILVTTSEGEPVPKVIDFGIAKAIEGRLGDQTAITSAEQFIGTPAYMSPEQAEMGGLAVDTCSDIYSLGVLLYELLAGRTPFDGKELIKEGLDQMRRTLREEEPRRPSRLLTAMEAAEISIVAANRCIEPQKLISLLKGDLDWIVMKAIEKDRDRRYQTANGLGVDVRRFLSYEPVTARPPSRWYRLGKLVRRNRSVFASGAAAFVALAIGFSVSTVLFFRERDARREEMRLRALAEANSAINQAAVYVSQGKLSEAHRLLSNIEVLPHQPSFDGVSAFRSVATWLALQKRWHESADFFFPLLEIDKLDDWTVVTLDYQACGVVLAASGDRERYKQFCQAAIATYGATTNGDTAGRILKSCLLFPPDGDLIKQLQPMGSTADRMFSSIPQDANFPSWALVHLGLWHYRIGDYAKAEYWCERIAKNEKGNSLQESIRLIRGMAELREGKTNAAKTDIADANQVIGDEFRENLREGNIIDGFWFDWVFAKVLAQEAIPMVPSTLESK